MTAVIGILNKSAITMAADSAVTVSGYSSQKIYNTANKIFTLSKYHPIGIIIYSSATFMGIPWETIIKLYRKNLKDKCFSKLEDYKDDFLNFLKDKNYYTSIEDQKENLKRFTYLNLEKLKKEVAGNLSDELAEDELIIEFYSKLEEKIRLTIDALKEEQILDSFTDYTEKDFEIFAKEIIKENIENIFNSIQNVNIPENIISMLVKQYFYYYVSDNFIDNETGLIFGGFGDEEIYPSLTSVLISEVIDNRLRYKNGLGDKISNQNNASIIPFAQKDVIETFIQGVDPEINFTYITSFNKILEGFKKNLIDLTDDIGLKQKFEDVDIEKVTEKYIEEMKQYKSITQVIPTLNTIAILSKEDLSELAESLIYLTYLKRRMTSSEESVGGPVDVAIISKGDGFIWKKRKHYFDENLNKHFMKNYFK